ncbi:MAG: (Fe-S)-binding protein [Anaerolineae bacterium]|nr:(Fe-S)-binding protein [Anaerolineae bacterium]
MPDPIKQTITRHRAYYCLECGKCTATCPVARQDSGFSPRRIVEEVVAGRAHAVLESPLAWACLTCRRCSEICPSDVHYSEFTRELRILAREIGHQGACTHGDTIHTWMRMMADPALKQNRLDWLMGDLQVSPTSDTVYWVGCLPYYDVLFRRQGFQGVDIARAAVRVLNALDIVPAVLADERCCGHDLLWQGDVNTFRHLAELNLELLRSTGARRIVTSCPECAYTLKVDYPAFVGNTGMEVLHIAELLSASDLLSAIRHLLSATRHPPSATHHSPSATYQDPCRLGRYMHVYDAPRQLLRALGIEIVEMAHAGKTSTCCGTSGWTNCGATSKAIQVERLREARATGAEMLVTACAKCQIHFLCAMDDPRLGAEIEMPVRDLITLVANALE